MMVNQSPTKILDPENSQNNLILILKNNFLFLIFVLKDEIERKIFSSLQSGASSLAKHGGDYFSAVYGSIKDPIAAPGPYEPQEI